MNVLLKILNLFRYYIAVRKEDFTDADCIAIFVLTHGKWNKLSTKNYYYTPDLLWNTFTAEKCPSLGGKPKMFFINACRGDLKDYGVEYVDSLTTDGPNSNPETKYKLPIHTDMLIAFSTVEGTLPGLFNSVFNKKF